MDERDRRVELVTETGSDGVRAQLVGAALVLSLVLGFPALRDAATGLGSFEFAIGRFLLCAVVCLAGANRLSRIFEQSETRRSANAAGDGDQLGDAEKRRPTDMRS